MRNACFNHDFRVRLVFRDLQYLQVSQTEVNPHEQRTQQKRKAHTRIEEEDVGRIIAIRGCGPAKRERDGEGEWSQSAEARRE